MLSLSKALETGRLREFIAQEQARGIGPIFPQMAGWLPEEEGAQLRFEFDTEMARLKAA